MRSAVLLFLFASLVLVPLRANALPGDALLIPTNVVIQPAELAAMLKGAGPPAVLQVGFSTLYAQAHIPGAKYAGPGNSDDGIANLKKQVGTLPRDKPVVIYCGCCPWEKCPNIDAAFTQMTAMGFKQIKVLYLATSFGADWVDKGYPVTKGP